MLHRLFCKTFAGTWESEHVRFGNHVGKMNFHRFKRQGRKWAFLVSQNIFQKNFCHSLTCQGCFNHVHIYRFDSFHDTIMSFLYCSNWMSLFKHAGGAFRQTFLISNHGKWMLSVLTRDERYFNMFCLHQGDFLEISSNLLRIINTFPIIQRTRMSMSYNFNMYFYW